MAEPENDKLFVLVTEALRAGPGSAVWQEAQRALSAEGVAAGDERRRLLAARSRLEQTRDWRKVQPRAGFTRRVMGAVDQLAAGDTSVRFVGRWLVGLLAVGLVVAVGGAVWWGVSGGGDGGRDAVRKAVMTLPAGAIDFGETWPDSTRIVGSLPLNFEAKVGGGSGGGVSRGLGFALVDVGAAYAGAAVVLDKPVDVEAGVAVELDLVAGRLGQEELASGSDWVVQLFVSSGMPVDKQRGTGGAEVSVSVGKPVAGNAGGGGLSGANAGLDTAGGGAFPLLMVAPGDGTLTTLGPRDRWVSGAATLRLKILKGYASVEVNGTEVWAGKHALPAGTTPTFAGIRLLGRGDLGAGRGGTSGGAGQEGPVVVKQIRVLAAPRG